ncbi:putative protein ANTI-SILENCING 1 [Cocos nucifera]|uniref:RRM domain-containing protein n=1 Tax=Cocos nucifera TaxID=13894 RepID=A0A8K0I5M2_COCNU|nr:putative protein ANTI-SILENCING 1 [Cocos nucifera]
MLKAIKYLLNWKADQKPKFEANSSKVQKLEDKPSRKMMLADDPAKPLDKLPSVEVKLSEKNAKPLDESLKKGSPAAPEDEAKKADLQIVGAKRRPDQKPKPGLEAIGDKDQKPKFEASAEDPMSEDKPSKKMRLTDDLAKSIDKASSDKLKLGERKTKTLDNSLKKSPAVIVEKDKRADPQTLEVTRRPDIPWEVRMKNADEQGTLVFIENFDPHYTSSEIEDIFYHAIKQSCRARVVQQATFQDPNYGQAYVIFRTKEAADQAVSKINTECMMLPDGRPLICSKGMLKMPQTKSSTFTGHYSVKLKPQLQREEMKRAVSTSHCSQGNTIEYEMAMDWILLQEKSVRWWDRLFKGHRYEKKQGKKSLKLK